MLDRATTHDEDLPGKLIQRSEEYGIRASMTSRFRAPRSPASKVQRFLCDAFLTISDRNVQKFSTNRCFESTATGVHVEGYSWSNVSLTRPAKSAGAKGFARNASRKSTVSTPAEGMCGYPEI